MSGHPDRLLSDLELHNFSVFLRANPHLAHPSPQGAFDSAKNVRRVPGKSLRVPVKDFSKGGKFDATRYGLAFDEGQPEVRKPALDLAALRKLAMSLSEESWAAFREACIEAGAEDSEEDDKRGSAKDTPLDPEIIAGKGKEDARAEDRAIPGRSSFAERWPDIAGIKSDAPLAKPKKRAPVSAASEKSFAERYPHVAGMKVWSR